MPDATVAVVDDIGWSANGKLAAALDRAGFWDIAAARRELRPCRVVIKPETAGFAAGSPSVTDPMLVEHLIDLLHDRGFTDVAVVGASDSSALWAENRDLLALSDLLGYRFISAQGRPYDIIDLADQVSEDIFGPDSVLHGCGISRVWLDADLRIVFSKNRTDEEAGYALCLDTLIGVLPQTDKDLHYRRRRHPGDVVAALLTAVPVDFCLIDAIVSAHGACGRHAPVANDTGTIIAASDIVLADHVGAMKMGLEAQISPIYSRVLRSHKLPHRFTMDGTLCTYSGWQNVPLPALRASQARGRTETLARLVEPWLQQLDPDLFPLKHPLDARLNGMLLAFFADTSTHQPDQYLLAVANQALGCIGYLVGSYRTLCDKDSLLQASVPLGFDPDTVDASVFDDLVPELRAIAQIASEAPPASDELRWRYVDEAVVFQYRRVLPIAYEFVIQRMDVARTIQYMNDYLGGVAVPLMHDAAGRVIRQAERNIYLPQPNYLVLYDGKPIDVSKLEIVEYHDGCRRLYWKTILSENDSASHDDGIATFERVADGTCITFAGRQQFTLPPFWQAVDLDNVPEIKSALVTHAYRTFFARTIANLEALVEGREIRIGRPVDEPTPPPVEQLMPWLLWAGEMAMPLLRKIMQNEAPLPSNSHHQRDSDGFVHITPTPATATEAAPGATEWIQELAGFIRALGDAVIRDVAPRRDAA